MNCSFCGITSIFEIFFFLIVQIGTMLISALFAMLEYGYNFLNKKK